MLAYNITIIAYLAVTGDDQKVPISGSLLADLAAGQYHDGKAGILKCYERRRLAQERTDVVGELILDGRESWHGLLLTPHDPAWVNIKRWLAEISGTHSVVCWQEAAVADVAGCRFGIQLNVLADMKSSQESVISIKSCKKPTGVAAVMAWSRGHFSTAMPRSRFARDVLELNLKRIVHEQMCSMAGSDIQMILVYGDRGAKKPDVYQLPPEYVCTVRSLFVYVCAYFRRTVNSSVCILSSDD